MIERLLDAHSEPGTTITSDEEHNWIWEAWVSSDWSDDPAAAENEALVVCGALLVTDLRWQRDDTPAQVVKDVDGRFQARIRVIRPFVGWDEDDDYHEEYD